MSTDTTQGAGVTSVQDVQTVADDAAKIATAVAPKYSAEIRLADSLVPAAVHIGLGIAHLFQHWFHHTKSTPNGSK